MPIIPREAELNNPATEKQKNMIAYKFGEVAHVPVTKMNWNNLDKPTAQHVISCMMDNNWLGAINELEDFGFEFPAEAHSKALDYMHS